MKRGIIVFFSIVLTLIISPYLTYAFGISTQYMEGDTLRLRPGEEYIYTFTVQNGEDQDYYVTIEYNSTGNIAEMGETQKTILKYTYDTTFEILIQVPRDALQGETYSITYSARPQINESGSVTMGVEILRGLTVEVTGEEMQVIPKGATDQETSQTGDEYDNTKKYLMIIIIITISVMVLMMVGKTSKKIALKIGSKKQTSYTISQAMSLEDVKVLLKKISDEEFEFPEIKKIFREKLTELSSKRTTKSINEMSRKELIETIDKFSKGKL